MKIFLVYTVQVILYMNFFYISYVFQLFFLKTTSVSTKYNTSQQIQFSPNETSIYYILKVH